MRVLVTGARGFIGARLCARLSAAGAEVHGSTRASGVVDPDVAWHRVDLTDAEDVLGLLRDVAPDVVYHLASHVSGARDVDAVLPTFEGNLTSTVTLLAAAEEANVGRLVLAGSMEQPQAVDESAGVALRGREGGGRSLRADVPCPLRHAGRRAPAVHGLRPGQRDLTKLVPYAGPVVSEPASRRG